MNGFEFVVEWFKSHCDGDWEHDRGITIATLDNPGWSVDIRIEDTELHGVESDWVVLEASDDDWIHWRATGRMFEARCGPLNLAGALEAFRRLAEADRK